MFPLPVDRRQNLHLGGRRVAKNPCKVLVHLNDALLVRLGQV